MPSGFAAMLFASLLALLVGCGDSAAPPAKDAVNDPVATAAGPAAVAPITASTPGGEGLAPIRIGWQTTWATQGQLVAVLLHTDILAKNGFAGEFTGFPYGGPLNEGALAGGLDVIFTADQPALSLAAKAPSWGIVGRLMYNRVGTFVPNESPVRTPADLKDKKLAVPFGAAAQREAMEAVAAAGLDPAKDVKLVNLGIEEILGVVRAGQRDGKWGEIDAAAAWDPTFAEIETSKRARTIASSVVTSVVVMDDAYAKANAGADTRFMTALAMAYDVYRADPARADRWFQQEAKLRFNLPVLSAAAAPEPNLKAATAADIRVHLTDEDVAGIGEAAAFMLTAGLLQAPVAMDTVIRPSARVPVATVDTTAVVIRP